ncbi:hypothetical protein SmJEL517_g00020 [Synchytrium microbalum]|uniref:Haloacid dehalogenase-like hydrolase domain-containing protein 2 n=1 Tax=Synchytrium microbalum TaxID=1806994 RepID=A0A507CAB8_9FUNG|nr:uncharacterized protein SmJEL517_g00020 [Synchytrium microbalum]TPX38027.1 hypothetical protein SmJEL517_g00020 [Synchytrium microbalum]
MGLERMIKGVLIDLSGTLHVETTPTLGAVNALANLRAHGFKIRFVTNTTKESRNKLLSRLTTMGFDVSGKEIFTSMTSARNLVTSMSLRPYLLIEDAAMEDWEGVDTSNPNAVVVGLAPSKFNYSCLTDAMNVLLNNKNEAKLIGIHKGRYFATQTSLALGPGPFVQALEYATDMPSIVVGKPSMAFFQTVLDDMGIKAEEAAMIGDDARDDVIGALKARIKSGFLVKTGKYRPGDETKHEMAPTYTVDTFADAVNILCNSN